MQHNLLQSNFYFELDKNLRKINQDLSDEYLNMLAILFGGQINSGDRRIKEFLDMSMSDAEVELRFRTKINTARANNLRQDILDKEKQNEEALIAELKNFAP